MAVTSVYGSGEPRTGTVLLDMCSLQINIGHDVIPNVACSLCIALGLVYCFFGYRCFKMVTFLSGFMCGWAAVLLVLQQQGAALEARLGAPSQAGLGLGLGLSVLCGLGAMLLPPLGLMLGGVQLGAVLGLSLLLLLSHCCGAGAAPAPFWLPLANAAAAAVAAAVCAALALCWPKPLSVAHTGALGAAAVTLGVDRLLGAAALQARAAQLLQQVAAPPSPPLCWFHWAIAAIFPVLGLAGLLVQWGVTARGVSHVHGCSSAAHKKQKKYAKRQRCRDSRRRPQMHRRRKPPLLKRYAGDVLAPSYLQSLQERQTGTGSSSSSVSTITHTLIDFDFETGSMVPLTAASPVFTV